MAESRESLKRYLTEIVNVVEAGNLSDVATSLENAARIAFELADEEEENK